MDPLFEELLNNINELVSLGDKATYALSNSGLKDQADGSLAGRQSVWKKYLEEIKETLAKLQATLSPNNLNKFYLDQLLAYFRELPRRLSEGGDPEWSALYPSIDRTMGRMHVLLLKIDRKYKLGQHKND